MNVNSNTKIKKCKNDKDLCAKYFDIIDEDNIDDKYYELCILLEDKWFNDFDKWVKIGYALYNESSVDKDIALNTWLKLLEDRSDKFNQIECLRIWDRQSEDGKNKVSMGTIVNAVSQTNRDAYQQWKIDFPQATKKNEVIRKEEAKTSVLEEINNQLSTMDRNELYENNNIEFNDLLFKSKKTTISSTVEIATLINQTLRVALNNGEITYHVKEIVMYEIKQKDNSYVEARNPHIIPTKINVKAFEFNIEYNGIVENIKLSEILDEVRDNILYKRVILTPFGVKKIIEKRQEII